MDHPEGTALLQKAKTAALLFAPDKTALSAFRSMHGLLDQSQGYAPRGTGTPAPKHTAQPHERS